FHCNQGQWLLDADDVTYNKYIKASGNEACVELLKDGGKLMWIGPKHTEKVLLYFHGGGYFYPMLEPHIYFLDYVRRELEKKGTTVGVATLVYTLLPDGAFPGPLRGNMITQVLAHLLRPLPSVPAFSAHVRLGGACLISPWMALEGDICTQSFEDNDSKDILTKACLQSWGKNVMACVPLSFVPYADAVRADKGWFEGLSGVINRLLVTSGQWECLTDAQSELYEKYLLPVHDDVQFMLQENGVHDEFLLEFDATKRERYSEFSGKVVEWVSQTFSNMPS
ncbi:hypothetical protein BDZ89DRAFT_1058166, partial [Hymenopellis radicata]